MCACARVSVSRYGPSPTPEGLPLPTRGSVSHPVEPDGPDRSPQQEVRLQEVPWCHTPSLLNGTTEKRVLRTFDIGGYKPRPDRYASVGVLRFGTSTVGPGDGSRSVSYGHPDVTGTSPGGTDQTQRIHVPFLWNGVSIHRPFHPIQESATTVKWSQFPVCGDVSTPDRRRRLGYIWGSEGK